MLPCFTSIDAASNTPQCPFSLIPPQVRTYAHQVAGRLIDNKHRKGTDGCLTGCKKYTQSTGRFVARFIYGAADIKEDRDEADHQKKKGTDKKKKEAAMQSKFDDRTLNFAKVARLSKFNKNPYFWREYGLSLANMFLRIVGDIQAIFNAYFANDAEWDGDCKFFPRGAPTPTLHAASECAFNHIRSFAR